MLLPEVPQYVSYCDYKHFSNGLQNPLVSLFATVKSAILRSPPKECYPFLSKLAASGRPMRELVANVIGLAVGSSVNYSQALAQVIAFYLDDSRAKERAALIEVCKRDDPKSAELLRGYVREAMRLDPQFAGLFRTVQANDTIPQGPGLAPMNVTKGDLLFASFRNAQLNVCIFFLSVSTCYKVSIELAGRLPQPYRG